MKEKIMYLILGILIGAVITAGCFLVFSKSSSQGMNGGNMPEMPSGDMMGGENGNNGEKPSDPPDGNTVAPSDTGTTAPETTSGSDTTNQNS